MRDVGLFASAGDLRAQRREGAVRQFGGIKVFSSSSRELNAGINRVCRSIVRVSGASWGLNPSMLRYLVQQDLNAEIPKRVFSALLGYSLRRGDLDAVICEGSQGTPFRVIIHRDRIAEFANRTRETADQLCKHRTLQISQVRDKYFRDKAKGSWTQAMYVAARLVRLGIAEYQDQYTIKMPSVLANAIMYSDECFDTLDA